MGTSNTRHRLQQQYGRNASFRLDPRPDGGTIATILIDGLVDPTRSGELDDAG